MNRLTSFFLGIIVGAAGLYISMNYYVVRANDGMHFVPKLAAKIEMPYYDIREYTLQDWQNNQALALAIVQSNKTALIEGSALDGFKRSAEELLGRLTGSIQTEPGATF